MMVGTSTHAATAAAAAVANAIKASGAIVSVSPADFGIILSRSESPLVVTAPGGWLSKNKRQYLTAYRGLVFYTISPEPLILPGTAEVITARSIWIPG